MALKEALTDDESIEFSFTVKLTLKHCPFCGKFDAFLISYKCTDSPYRPEGSVIYQSTITCGNYRCNAQVLYNHDTLSGSREEVIRIWQNRARE